MAGFLVKLQNRQAGPETGDAPAGPGQANGLVDELIFKNSLQLRTTTVVTISFNIVAAFLIIASILIDARNASKRKRGSRPLYEHQSIFPDTAHFSRNIFQSAMRIHPADTFPFIISAAIAVQGILFLGVQSTGLNSLRAHNCRAISQLVWPGWSHARPRRH